MCVMLQKKKSDMESVNSRLQMVMTSRKASLDYMSTLKSLRTGRKCEPLPCPPPPLPYLSNVRRRRVMLTPYAVVYRHHHRLRHCPPPIALGLLADRSQARHDLEQLPATAQIRD